MAMFGLFEMSDNGRWTPLHWFDANAKEAMAALKETGEGRFCVMEDHESTPIFEAVNGAVSCVHPYSTFINRFG